MKICHITTVHTRYDIRIFIKECVSLARAGHEVILIVNDKFKDEVHNGVSIRSLNCVVPNRLLRIFSITAKRKAFDMAKSLKADIYHFHDPELLGLAIKLKKQGFRIIYDVHEDVPRQILTKGWIPHFIRGILSKMVELYENRCAMKYDAIITPTPHISKRFQKLNNAVWEVCNFPSLEEFDNSENDYSNTNPACYVGGLTKNRGIKQIAEATHKAGIRLNLCGEFYPPRLKQEILGGYNNVHYMGVLEREQIVSVTKKSSMGFVTLLNTPNDMMAYPIKMFEYMAAGIPVIASDFPVYKEIVEGNKCGICVNPYDVDAIYSAIVKIRENQDYANELGKNGRMAIMKKYNWESQIKKILECYDSCTNRHS